MPEDFEIERKKMAEVKFVVDWLKGSELSAEDQIVVLESAVAVLKRKAKK